MDDLVSLSATQAIERFRTGALSPVELTRAVLDRIDTLNESYNAYNLVDADRAIEGARESEARWRRGQPLGAIDGIPTAIKDVVLTKGWPTLRGSLCVNPIGPWEQDAPATRALRASGAILLGKTTTPELGWKAVTDSPLTGVTRNPWDERLTPGGSSGGSSAALSAGMATLAVGTDGGGSIRIPAAFTGVVGFKPTFGRVPVWPPSAFGTLSHVGPMARSVEDAALMLDIMARPDPMDWQSLPVPDRSYVDSLTCDVRDLRIAFSPDLGFAGTKADIAAMVVEAAGVLGDLGAQVEEVAPPFEDPLQMFNVLWYAGAAQAIRGRDADALSRTDPGLVSVAEKGDRILLGDYLDAGMRRSELGTTMALFHDRFDLLLTPTMPIPAFDAGRESPADWPGDRWPTWTPFTYPFNLTQQPAISVPAGFTGGLPVGLQIVGARYRDDLVLRAAHAYQQAHPIELRPPTDRT